MSTFITSLIRTVVPMLVGRLAVFLLALGITLPDTAFENLEATLTVALAAAYYAGVRALEKRWPQAGWLLGKAVQPVYAGQGITAEEIAMVLAARETDATPPEEGWEPKYRADG